MEPPENKGKSARIVDALYRVANFIGYVGDLRQLLELIMNESKEVVDAEASSLMLYDPATNELFFEVALGEKGEAVKQIRLSMGDGIAGAAARNRSTIVVNDAKKDPRHFRRADEVTDFTTRNLIATPMIRSNRLIGVLEVLNKRNNAHFTDDDIRVLEFFAGQAAIAIENTRLIEENTRAERLAALGQAVASISHYIKNVIGGMEGSISLMDMALHNNDSDTMHEIWPIFKRSAKRISRLVLEMLNYSRPRTPYFERADINEICKEIFEAQQSRAKEKNISLELNLDDAVPESRVDVEIIHDAVLNLVSNAFDALNETGSSVEISTGYLPEQEEILIRVSDNGPGIPRKVQPKIFEPFFTTKGSKGTGLGLAIVKKSIEEHGGSVRLISTKETGTAFLIRIPIKHPDNTDEEVHEDGD